MSENSIFKKTTKSVSDGSENILNQFKNGLSKIGDLGKSTKNTFINYVKDVFDVLPLIEKAGFRTNRLIVGISVPPSIEIHFSRFKELNEQESEKLLELYADKKMFKLIFKALVMANEFQGKLSTSDLVFSEICIEISIPPKVSIKYLNKDIAKINKIETEFT